MPGPRKARRKAALSLGSQGFSTGQNLLMSVTVALVSSPAEYGGWGIAFAVFVALQSVTRGAVSTPQILAAGARDDVPDARERNAAFSASALVAGAVAAVVIPVAFLLAEEITAPLSAFGIALVPALVHDALRYSAVAGDRYEQMMGLDALRFIVQAVCTALLLVADMGSAFTLTVAWGGAAVIPILVAAARGGAQFSLDAVTSFYGPIRGDCAKMAGEAAIGTFGANAVPVVIGATLGLTDAGYFRAGMTALGLINLFIAGMMPMLTKDLKSLLTRGGDDVAFLWRWSGLLAAVSALYGALLAVTPGSIGNSLMGASWVGFHAVLAGFVLQSIARSVFTVVPVALRAREGFNEALSLRVTSSAVQIALPWVGAVMWGLPGAVWGYAAAAVVNSGQALRSWHRLRRRSTHPESAG